jgi:hypothetical protein
LRETGAVSTDELEEGLRAQAAERFAFLCRGSAYRYTFTEAAAPPAGLGGHPLPLLQLLRLELGPRLDPVGRARLAGELQGRRFSLRKALRPPRALLSPPEERLCEALSRPRALAEVLPAAVADRSSALGFLTFLRQVGALALDQPAATNAEATASAASARDSRGPRTDAERRQAARVLGVSEGADARTARRAYLRLARELHPDRHADASEAARIALAARFSQVADAYRAWSRA